MTPNCENRERNGSGDRCVAASARTPDAARSRGSGRALRPQNWSSAHVGKSHVKQAVAGIVVGEKNRYLPIDILGHRALAFRADLWALSGTISGTIARTFDNP
jgi:hypothetical protein